MTDSMVLDRSLERGLPENTRAERVIIGGMIDNEEVALDVLQRLHSEHFSLDSHRRIYAALATLVNSGKPADSISLMDELNRRKELEAVGGIVYLSSLTDRLPRRKEVSHYIRLVRQAHTARTVIHICNGAMAAAFDGAQPVAETVRNLEDALLALRAESDEQACDLKELVLRTVETMTQERATEAGKLLGLTTCLSELDELTTGIRPTELWVLGAPPARAKTAFALQIARENAKLGNPVGMHSLEMTGDPMLRRCASALTGIRAAKMKDPRRLSPYEFERVQEALAELAQWPLILDDRPIRSLSQVIAKSRLWVRRNNVKLIIVDHLLALAAHAKGKDIRERVNNALNALREFARDEGVGVLLLHHLRRPPDPNDRPTESDLKESGDIEGAAHVVLLLFREIAASDAEQFRKGDFTGNDEIIAAKIRDGGERGTFDAWFDTRTLEWRPRYLKGLQR